MDLKRIATLWRTTRPSFLMLSLVCVGLGAGVVWYADLGGDSFGKRLALVVLAAIAAHVSVNALNEYLDFKSGLDALTRRTPFSGGSGALPERPQDAAAVLMLALASLTVTLTVGAWFVFQVSWLLLPLGLLGVVVILTYTHWINRRPLLCLVAPGLAFGPLMVGGTELALSGALSARGALVSLLPFFLTNNLLLLNQLPDAEADRQVGRRHLVITHGWSIVARVYALFVTACIVVLMLGLILELLPSLALLALLPLGAGIKAAHGIYDGEIPLQALLPLLRLNVVAAVVTPATLGLALSVS